MSSKLPVSELLRLACLYAIQDRELLIDCYKNQDEPFVQEQLEYLRQLRAYMRRRWPGVKLAAREHFKDAVPVSLAELREKPEEARDDDTSGDDT